MMDALLATTQLRQLLPDDLRREIRDVRLEMTPHRAFRFVLLDARGHHVAIAHLDDAARRCLPPDVEKLSDVLRPMLPKLLAVGELSGRPTTIREYFDGHSLDAEFGGGDPTSLMVEAEELLSMVQAERRSDRIFDEGELQRLLAAAVARIRDCARFNEADYARLAPLIDSVRQLSGQTLVYALHHGDFQFSNLLRGVGGRFQIIDWELSLDEAPLWMDRIHLCIAYEATTSGRSYGGAAQSLQAQWATGEGLLRRSFGGDASQLDPRSLAGQSVLCVLHGMSHFLQRVPHLADGERIGDFLSAAEAFLRL